MRAIVQDEYGAEPEGVLRLADIERPAIGDDQVLVRVAAAGLDRGTWHMMAGLPLMIRVVGFGVRRPKNRVPGLAVAGTVEAVGPKVDGFAPGDEVFGAAHGSFAEFAAADPGKLARKPANLSFEQSAAVPISAPTAVQALRKARVRAGETVLITGASGGVGTYAVQLAALSGAEVTGVCSTAKLDLVRGLGAKHVVDYHREDFADAPERYDVILDIGGNTRLSRLRRVLTPTGRLVLVGGETDGKWLGGFDRSIRATLLSPFVRQHLSMLASSEKAQDLDVLRDLIEAGNVVPTIDRTYPLADAPSAMRALIDGQVRGKVVITV